MSASELFSHHLIQDVLVECQISDQALEPRVLIAQLAQLLDLAQAQVAVALSPIPNCLTKVGRGHYALLMAAPAQTLTMLSDSPVGLATFIIDFDRRLRQLMVRAFDGEHTSPTRRDPRQHHAVWLTNTAVSAARLYRENTFAYFAPKNVTIPVGVSVFPDELYLPPRSWVERAYPNLVHYNRLDRGGHFPAWEQPELFTRELRAAFGPLRS